MNTRFVIEVKYTNGGSYSESVLGGEAWARQTLATWQAWASDCDRVQSVTLSEYAKV